MFPWLTNPSPFPSARLIHPVSAALLALAVASAPSGAATIRVPDDQPTIQAAIDVAINGDLVLVEAGTYAEELDFLGKAIVLRSESGAAVTTIDPGAMRRARPRASRHSVVRVLADGTVEVIDPASGRRLVDAHGFALERASAGGNDGSVVVFDSGETRESVLDGFTITGGDASFGGGGIRIEGGAAPTVVNNVVDGNRSCTEGAGIAVAFSSPLIENNTISDNHQFGCSGGPGGGGVSLRGAASAEIRGNTISGNSFGAGGGLALFAAGTPTIIDNAVQGNSSSFGGAGFDIVNVSDASIVQNVVTGNSGSGSAGDGFDWLVPSSGRGPILLNNTVSGNDDLEVFADGFDEDAELVDNVIVASSGGTAVECGDFNDTNPPVLRFNNVFAPGGTVYGGICGDPTGIDGNLSADPLFVDAAGGNLRLAAGSPSIVAGDNAAADLPATDFDGNQRILDGNGDAVAVVDQGAFEKLDEQPIFSDGFEDGDTSNWDAFSKP